MASTSKSVKRAKASAPGRALYLYAISQMPKLAAPPVGAVGIDGLASVEALLCENYLCWISRVSKDDFADRLAEQMQDLEWLATAGLRHQRAVAAITKHVTSLPARFGTVFLSEDSLAQHVKERRSVLRAAFELVADADEWGIKIFATASPVSRPLAKAATGSEYLKRKAQLLQPRGKKKLDEEVRDFVAALTRLAVATSPGGKASAGQPGLLWHGSFLVRREDRKKLDAALKKYATRWKDTRRIDCSGPWPPYSFVGDNVR